MPLPPVQTGAATLSARVGTLLMAPRRVTDSAPTALDLLHCRWQCFTARQADRQGVATACSLGPLHGAACPFKQLVFIRCQGIGWRQRFSGQPSGGHRIQDELICPSKQKKRNLMKLVRYGRPGQEKPGLIDASGQLRDLSSLVSDIGPDQLGDAALQALRQHDASTLPAVEGAPRLGSPLTGTRKFIAIGLNYADHAAESGLPIPAEPVVFMKATSCIQGPNDAVMLPSVSS